MRPRSAGFIERAIEKVNKANALLEMLIDDRRF